jgi:repressor LexA
MRSSDQLSARQRDILGFIEEFNLEHGYPPSIREIQDGLRISSTSVVAYNLRALESKGLIDRDGRVSRGIKIKNMTPMPLSRAQGGRVPLLGVITAGQPLPNPEDTSTTAVEMIEVPVDLAPPEKLQNVYALKVRGHSMIDALIDDGDIVLMRYQETADNGQMVAVRIEDDNAVTLKRFYREGDKVKRSFCALCYVAQGRRVYRWAKVLPLPTCHYGAEASCPGAAATTPGHATTQSGGICSRTRSNPSVPDHAGDV